MKSVSRNTLIALLGLTALGVVSYWYFMVKPNAAPNAGPPTGFAMPVEAVKVTVGTVTDDVSAVGSLRSNETVIVRPEIEGRVSKILFSEGQNIVKGAKLIALEAAVYRAEFAKTQTDLALSRANYQRSLDLFEKNFISKRALDEALAKLKADEADVALAQARLDKTLLTAPFSGILGLRHVSVGDYVSAGTEIVNIEQINPLKVDFRVPELHLKDLAAGQAISVMADSFPGERFTGLLYAIDPLVDERGRDILIRATVPNPLLHLRPGLFARITLTLGKRNNALLVPEQAVAPFGDQHIVYRIVENKATRTVVRIGQRRNAQVEILQGLSADDTVITSTHMKLGEGLPVMVLPPPKGG
ncbi:MAG: efflux RND transporter periplasmic adaptor subunit [Burkholderiales bacterium]